MIIFQNRRKVSKEMFPQMLLCLISRIQLQLQCMPSSFVQFRFFNSSRFSSYSVILFITLYKYQRLAFVLRLVTTICQFREMGFLLVKIGKNWFSLVKIGENEFSINYFSRMREAFFRSRELYTTYNFNSFYFCNCIFLDAHFKEKDA